MTARYLIGDVLEVLPTLEENSVDLVLTSPPFLALRSYLPADHPDKAKEGGSQSTPGAFIDWLVDVVEALDRVLAPHGSMVIELGDTYSSSDSGDVKIPADKGKRYNNHNPELTAYGSATVTRVRGATTLGGSGWPADKSLTLIPELFRMTLVYGFNPLTGRQTRRWRLRNVIRWVRPNPPVGALGDKFRPATSELMVFCRTDEAGRRRYFDLDAVRGEFPERPHGGWPISKPYIAAGLDSGSRQTRIHPAGAPPLDWWEASVVCPDCGGSGCGRVRDHKGKGCVAGLCFDCGCFAGRVTADSPVTPPDWWNIPPGGYEGAHYAVWPPELLVKPIKAMCPERVCRTCGEPSRRIVERESIFLATGEPTPGGGRGRNQTASRVLAESWSDCSHDNYRPGMVLDPFAGSGTTLAVAVGHGRDAIGIDLDERNARLAEERIGFFLEVVQ